MILQLILGLILFFGVFVALLLLLAAWDTASNGLFVQDRVGQYGKVFQIYKFRTMHRVTGRISFFGAWMRKYKLDELPQLWNLLKGDMVLVGPRPDIPGYADLLQGNDRTILHCKPGLTGLASLKYRNEESILAAQSNAKEYNDTVIWPDKVRLHRWYAQHRTFWLDVQIVFFTLFPFLIDLDVWVERVVNR
jgi:lipopolysaccharide/colanic/teichoic acid biosynthesis glycosyltransferase